MTSQQEIDLTRKLLDDMRDCARGGLRVYIVESHLSSIELLIDLIEAHEREERR